ncbi:MAG: AAA family ATPase, partial [Nitrososphaeraceae archaeon]
MKISLTIFEAYAKDVGRSIARINYNTMGLLTVSAGDVIEIRDEVKGAKKTVAKCLRLQHLDEGKGIIRVDGLVRNNAGVAIGDTVVVRKIKAIPAEKVIVAP